MRERVVAWGVGTRTSRGAAQGATMVGLNGTVRSIARGTAQKASTLPALNRQDE
jgi:hypothetical protein